MHKHVHFELKKHYIFGVLCKTEGQMGLDRIPFCFRQNEHKDILQ